MKRIIKTRKGLKSYEGREIELMEKDEEKLETRAYKDGEEREVWKLKSSQKEG